MDLVDYAIHTFCSLVKFLKAQWLNDVAFEEIGLRNIFICKKRPN